MEEALDLSQDRLLNECIVLARVGAQYERPVSETKVSDCTSRVKNVMFRLMSPGTAKETQRNMDSLLRFRSGKPIARCDVVLSLQAVVSWVRRGSVPDVTRYTTRHALLLRRDRAWRSSTASHRLSDTVQPELITTSNWNDSYCSSLVFRQQQIRFLSDKRGFMFQCMLCVVIRAQQLCVAIRAQQLCWTIF